MKYLEPHEIQVFIGNFISNIVIDWIDDKLHMELYICFMKLLDWALSYTMI